METMYRDELDAMTGYYFEKTDQYFFTPDGIGGVWYDSEEEMCEEHGIEPADIVEAWDLSDY